MRGASGDAPTDRYPDPMIPTFRTLGRSIALVVLLAVTALAIAGPARSAPPIQPWIPPQADSLLAWSALAKTRFESNTGDSVGGANYKPYALVGNMGRVLLKSLGRSGMRQAQAVEDVLDSLGLDTEVAVDPSLPDFVLLIAHNPARPSASSVGFLYWFRGNDLRQQGVLMHGRKPRMRVWWTSKTEAPYEWAVVTENPSQDGRLNLLLVRLNETATFWVLLQYDVSGDLGGSGDAQFVDMNHDAIPELSVWTRAEAESVFEAECGDCPHLTHESTYVLRTDGYDLYDRRLLPTPYAAFTLFIRLLQQQNRPAASRLLEKPDRVDEAVVEGWSRRGRGVWKLEYAEPDQPWARWLAFRFAGPKGTVRYIVRFSFKDGRWLIKDWTIPRAPTAKSGANSSP